jgi:hypothetical protein
MKRIRQAVVAVLLAVWFFPGAGFAKTAAPNPPSFSEPSASPKSAAPARSSQTEAANFAARENQAKDLSDFKGGAVYVYLGSGAVLVLIIILIILLI